MDGIITRLTAAATASAPALLLRPSTHCAALARSCTRALSKARGRGVAPRALEALTAWAFTTFAGDGLTRLELLHQADNTASCRVAQKCGYELSSLRPAAPPAFPLEGHVHARARGL